MDDEDAITKSRDLLAALERGNSTQTRISALQNLYAFLEQQEEESELLIDVHDEIVNGLRAQLKVANPLVTAKVLGVLPIITDRLTVRQDGHCLHRVRYVMQTLLPPLLACLGDTRDRSREAAKAIIVQIAKAASAVTPLAATAANHSSIRSSHETPFALFERIVIESGLTSKVARVKEQITLLLPVLRQSIEKFPLRPFLPSLVDHLSDADANVREASRTTVISLFSNASPTAKSELKKEMEKKGTRKQTVDAILEQVFSASVPSAEPAHEPEHAVRKPPTTTSSNRFSTLNAALAAEEAGSGPSSRSASRSASRMGGAGDAKENDIRPVYIASSHELDRAFATMVPHFDGKETEHNWQNREQDVLKIRGMLKTSTYHSHPSAFAAGIRLLSEGILKAVASLRTTLSIHGITLISELAQQMGDDLEAQAETFLTALIRMAGFTKKIVANASQATVGEILKNVTYRHKYLELVGQGMQDKNFGTRAAMCQHLDTILSVHGKHRKHALEGHGGLNAISTICKKGLADPNKDVRASARNAFYRVEQIWPSTARTIFDSLDMSIQKQVESNRLPAGQPIPQSPAPSRTAAPSISAIASPRTPSNKIGPSSALLAAKRAAAASLAKERKEKAEREAQIQAERDMMMAEDEDEEDLMSSPSIGDLNDEELHSTPPLVIRQKLAQSPSPSPAPVPPKSPLRSRASSESTKSASVQPHSIPLPSSPVGNRSASRSGIARPTSSVIGARSRTTSTSSMASNRSAGRFGASTNMNYGSIAQRFEQQSAASVSTPVAKTTTNDSLPHADLSTDEFNRSVRVSTPSSPSRIPIRSPPRVLSPSTPEKEREATVADTSTMSFASSVQSGADTSYGQVPSSPTNRTKLPRPVSMMYSTPPSGKAGMTARHSHSLSTDMSPSPSANEWNEGKAAKTRSTQPPPSNGSENGSSPFITQKERGSAATEKPPSKPPTSITRTVVPPDATSAVKWFLGKADRLENATFYDEEPDYANLSPVKQRPESDGYVAQLYTGSATLRTFKGLVSLSKEFKLPQKGVKIMQEDDTPSLLGLDADAGANREYSIAIEMWQEGSLFERIFISLCKYLRSEDIITGTSKQDLQTAALVFLHRLVEFQFGLFTALDKERDLLDLLIDLIRRNHSGPSAAGVKSACQAIADRWTDQTDVIIGVTMLRSVLSQCMSLDDDGQETNGSDDTSQSNVAVLTLALRTLARLFGRLPGELVEEQLERCKHVVKKGLKHRQIETRQQAVGVLVAANSKIRDPQSLFGILQPIDKAQQDLLIYYMNRA
ncbi:ARM repeat-containing protein [Meira miltonrushii]|uniref:ARM repeat-containing protein n=1 Tax=Meira miltonrushii TaxID=1280837 RepID=A0A316V506_9BASI|nr:ARM repeat-containing protein [Meira miltonrushii]PWN32108.1 ARM repeat-containing protein [Meira miltonrushii]